MSEPTDSTDTTLLFEEVARRVVEEVVARLAASRQSSAPVSGPARRVPSVADRELSGRELLWVLASPCGHLEELCRIWRRFHRAGHAQRALVCADVAKRLEGMKAEVGPVEVKTVRGSAADNESRGRATNGAGDIGVSEAAELVARCDMVYLGSLGWRQARALGELGDEDPFVFLLLEALTAKRPVFCLRDGKLGGLVGAVGGDDEAAASRGGRASLGTAGRAELVSTEANGGARLAREARKRWREMESVGVRPVRLEEVARPLTALEAAKSSFQRATGGLLSEKDVERAAREGVRSLTLAPQTVVTPLARDRARQLGVEIQRS